MDAWRGTGPRPTVFGVSMSLRLVLRICKANCFAKHVLPGLDAFPVGETSRSRFFLGLDASNEPFPHRRVPLPPPQTRHEKKQILTAIKMPLILILTFFRRCVKMFLTGIGIETRRTRLRAEIEPRGLSYRVGGTSLSRTLTRH